MPKGRGLKNDFLQLRGASTWKKRWPSGILIAELQCPNKEKHDISYFSGLSNTWSRDIFCSAQSWETWIVSLLSSCYICFPYHVCVRNYSWHKKCWKDYLRELKVSECGEPDSQKLEKPAPIEHKKIRPFMRQGVTSSILMTSGNEHVADLAVIDLLTEV